MEPGYKDPTTGTVIAPSDRIPNHAPPGIFNHLGPQSPPQLNGAENIMVSLLAPVGEAINTFISGADDHGNKGGKAYIKAGFDIIAFGMLFGGEGKVGTPKELPVAPKEIGPAGDASAKVTKQIPKDWTKESTGTGGTIFKDPNNVSGNNVRVMQGDTESPNPAQQVPYVKQMQNGKQVDVNGQKVPSNSQEAHIPTEQFKFIIRR